MSSVGRAQIAGFLVISYHAMIAGWVLAYTWFFLSEELCTRGGAPMAWLQSSTHFITDSRAGPALWQRSDFSRLSLSFRRGD